MNYIIFLRALMNIFFLFFFLLFSNTQRDREKKSKLSSLMLISEKVNEIFLFESILIVLKLIKTCSCFGTVKMTKRLALFSGGLPLDAT